MFLLATLQDAAEEGIQQILSVRAEHGAGEAGREGVQCRQALCLHLLTRCLEHLQEKPWDELSSVLTPATGITLPLWAEGLRLLPHFPHALNMQCGTRPRDMLIRLGLACHPLFSWDCARP